MNILITGGNGFIAKHLTAYLSAQHTVYAPNKIDLDCLDKIAVEHFFNTHTVDIVIHTALVGRENLGSADPMYRTVAMQMWNNIRDQRHLFKKLIHFGSAYDAFNSQYGMAKKLIKYSCLMTENFYNLRIFGNYHHSENNSRFFKHLYASDRFVIGENRKFDYFNLEDIFPIVDLVINETIEEHNFDIVYKEKFTLLEQAMRFCVLNEVKTVIESPRTGDDLIGDSTILESFNLPFNGLEEGFKKYNYTASTLITNG